MGLPNIYNLLIAALAIGVAIMAQQRLLDQYVADAIGLYVLAILLSFFAYRRHSFRRYGEDGPLHYPSLPSYSFRLVCYDSFWWRFIPGIGGLSAISWSLWQSNQEFERPIWYAWWLYLASIVLLLLTALLLDESRSSGEDTAKTDRSQLHAESLSKSRRVAQREGWGHWLVLLLIVLLGAAMRLYRFDELPFGTWYDEAAAGLLAQRMMEDVAWRPVFPGSINITFHYTILIAWAMELLGRTTYAVRSISVIMGLGSVLAAYLAGREFFAATFRKVEGSAQTAGLVLAFIVAVARWNVNFSRIGMYNIATPFFALLAVGFLFRALRRGRYFDYGLAGLSVGLGLCFYPAYQLFVVALGLFLIYLVLAQWQVLRKQWAGLFLMVLIAADVFSPLALFAYKKPDIYFSRAQDTSLFAGKAPEERFPALVENARKHLLMFHIRGDPNGRHNLPGLPMLDPILGALSILGLALAFRWVWQPRALLLPIWLAITLLGGILSLDFEAPQSLRSIGSQPAAYLLALVPLTFFIREWQNSVVRYFRFSAMWPMLILLIPIGMTNADIYFEQQAKDFASWNAFSTPETITANILTELDEETAAYVISFFHGHPTINFLTQRQRSFRRLETTDRLPMAWPEGKNVVLLVNAESASLFDEARRFYPTAEYEEIQPPFGGPTVVYKVTLSQEDIAAIQGLTGRYYDNETWAGDPIVTRSDRRLAFDWLDSAPIAGDAPFSVEWEGVLNVKDSGTHQFFLQAPAQAEVYIGEDLVLDNEGELATALMLAEGNHNIRVRAVGTPGSFSLSWRPPNRSAEIIQPQSLYLPPVTSNGLLGEYFANDSWAGPPALSRIDPQFNMYFHVTPLSRPYTVEWSGKIAIPVSGTYFFGLESVDESTLWIDETEILTAQERNVYRETNINLTEGLHDIRLRFSDRTDHTHINFYWSPPGQPRQIVPPEVLFPPQGSYERIELPQLQQFIFDPEQPGTPTVQTEILGGKISFVSNDLAQPKGIVVVDAPNGEGLVVAADTGNQQLLLLETNGTIQNTIDSNSDHLAGEILVEPFDVALDQAGQVYLIDASTGQLHIFDRAGNHLSRIAADPIFLERARGLDVDQQGNIWIASTTTARVIALNQEGELIQEIPVWPGEDSQPVDVAVASNGNIFVTDAGIHKLVLFAPDGRRLLAWEIPVANSLNGAHLAIDDATGFIYLSEPEESRIAKLLPDGERVGEWPLNGPNGERLKPVGITVDLAGRVWFTDNDYGLVGIIEQEDN